MWLTISCFCRWLPNCKHFGLSCCIHCFLMRADLLYFLESPITALFNNTAQNTVMGWYLWLAKVRLVGHIVNNNKHRKRYRQVSPITVKGLKRLFLFCFCFQSCKKTNTNVLQVCFTFHWTEHPLSTDWPVTSIPAVTSQLNVQRLLSCCVVVVVVKIML